MSKQTPRLPIIGQPIFVISDNPLEDRITISSERGLLNSLVYFAVDAVKAMKLEYADDTMKKIIINRGMVTPGDDSKSLEILLDLDKNFGREVDASTIFMIEEEAQAMARKLNENQKKQCKKLLDLATKAYNEYDKVIAGSSTTN